MTVIRAALVATLGTMVGLAAFGAQAVTVNVSNDMPARAITADSLLDPTFTSGLVRVDFVGNKLERKPGRARSPFEGTAFQNVSVYHSVSMGAEARFDFDQQQRQFGLLFGSPDLYNTLSFFLEGSEVFKLTGGELVPASKLGLGAVYVMIGDIAFDEVRMTSDSDSFEFSDIFSLAAIPIPASLPLLLAGLVGLGMLRRRGRASMDD